MRPLRSDLECGPPAANGEIRGLNGENRGLNGRLLGVPTGVRGRGFGFGSRASLAAFEQVGGLLERQIVGDALVIAFHDLLANGDALEEELFAGDVGFEQSEIPVPIRDILLFDVEGAAAIQITENAVAKLDAAGEAAAEFSEAIGFGVYDEDASHVVEDFGLAVGGMKTRVRFEIELDEVALPAGVGVEQSV